MNIDAELSVAMPIQNNWIIFDVYNPSFQRGGQTRFSETGFYNKENGFQILSVVPKYWQRKDWSKIVLKGMIVVTALLSRLKIIYTRKLFFLLFFLMQNCFKYHYIFD